jgi:hypothetical protein
MGGLPADQLPVKRFSTAVGYQTCASNANRGLEIPPALLMIVPDGWPFRSRQPNLTALGTRKGWHRSSPWRRWCLPSAVSLGRSPPGRSKNGPDRRNPRRRPLPRASGPGLWVSEFSCLQAAASHLQARSKRAVSLMLRRDFDGASKGLRRGFGGNQAFLPPSAYGSGTSALTSSYKFGAPSISRRTRIKMRFPANCAQRRLTDSPAWAADHSAAGAGVKYTLPRFASCCYRSLCA